MKQIQAAQEKNLKQTVISLGNLLQFVKDKKSTYEKYIEMTINKDIMINDISYIYIIITMIRMIVMISVIPR